MPRIERCIPYTFDSYSGGMVADPSRKGSMMPNPDDGQDSNNEMSPSHSQQLPPEHLSQTDEEPMSPINSNSEAPSRPPELLLAAAVSKLPPAATLHGYVAKYAAAASRLVSKGSRKWLGDSLDSYEKETEGHTPNTPRDIYEFEDRLDGDILQRRREKLEDDVDDDRVFRRGSNASLLVEAALNVAENTLKSEGRQVGPHDRLLGYATNSTRYSPPPSVTSTDHLLPHDVALTTHIKYTAATDDERGHLEYTLEREYDPRDLPEVMVVHDGIPSRDLHESLTHDLHDNLHTSLDHLTPASVSDSSLTPQQDSHVEHVEHAHNLSLTKSDELSQGNSADPDGPLNTTGSLEPTLHVLDQLPVTHGMPVTLSSSLAVGIDMTYKHYRIVPETTVAGLSHDHLLAATPLEDTERSMGLETITSTSGGTPLSPPQDHLTDQIPLPELQPHDFRGLPALRSPEPPRSPYLSPSPTPETLRSYLIPADGLRSPFTVEQGIDMSRANLLLRPSDLAELSHRYQSDGTHQVVRTSVYEIERPISHSMDLTVPRSSSVTSTVYVTSPDVRHSLDLTLPRHDPDQDHELVRSGSPFQHTRAGSPSLEPSPHQLSPNTQLSPHNQLSPHTQLPSYSQVSPSTQLSPHPQMSPLPHIGVLDRGNSSSPEGNLIRQNIEGQSPSPSTSSSVSLSHPLPPISRIVSSSPHSGFYSSRQLIPISRQDSPQLPTHLYSESFITTGSGGSLQSMAPLTPVSVSNKDRSSPYLQYPSSPYPRHQDLSSPPPTYHYQYY